MTDKYEMPSYVLSRVRYYDGEYLKDDEFIDEQKYHLDRRRRHHRLLQVAGVCEGLIPSMTDGSTIQVGPGTAIDDLGQTILIESDKSITVNATDNGTLSIYITFAEVEDRPADGNSAVASNTRFTVTPVLQLSATAIDHGVVLGQAVISDGTLNQVTTTGRTYSGVRFPGPSGAGYAMQAHGDDATGQVDLQCSLKVTGDATVDGSLKVSGTRMKNVGGKGILDTGTNDSTLRINPDSQFDRVDIYKSAAMGSGGLAIGESTTQPTGRLKVTENAIIAGAVAIGTTSPGSNKLQVTGAVQIDGNLGIQSDGILSFGNDAKRQMVNLYSDYYGLGVQTNTAYVRTVKNFVVYRGGGHNDNELNAGTGGTALMMVDNTGMAIGTTDPASNMLRVAGTAQIDNDLTAKMNVNVNGTLEFGTTKRQMINLYNTNNGIGVQSNGMYLRTTGNLCVYQDGTHDDTALGAGTGGTALMVLNSTGLAIGSTDPSSNKLRVAGKAQIDDILTAKKDINVDGALSLGSSTRQMVNLYGTTHGLGVQTSTTYLRTSTQFAFYKGGVHSNSTLDPGTGGTALMMVNSTGLAIGTTDPSSNKLRVAGNAQIDGTLTVNDKFTVAAGEEVAGIPIVAVTSGKLTATPGTNGFSMVYPGYWEWSWTESFSGNTVVDAHPAIGAFLAEFDSGDYEMKGVKAEFYVTSKGTSSVNVKAILGMRRDNGWGQPLHSGSYLRWMLVVFLKKAV